jgi:hypothetical protein
MATSSVLMDIGSGNGTKFVTNPARYDAATDSLLFSATQTESRTWKFRMPQDFASALTAKLQYSMVEVMKISDAGSDPDTASFASVNEVSGGTTVPGATTTLDEISITLSNDDSVAAGDWVTFRINRDHDDADDTATGDLKLQNFALEYTTS